jgi:hypothetical protein
MGNTMSLTCEDEPLSRIRWRCTTCGRIDARHPLTTAKEMQFPHTTLMQMGYMWGQMCEGQRVPERLEPGTGEWVPDQNCA